MKHFLCFLLMGALLFSTSSFTSASLFKTPVSERAKVEVVFNRHLDFNDIVKIKLDLSQKGIVINYSKLEFDENGKLQYINFSVDCKDGFKGSAESSLTNQSHFGFFRDYTKNAKVPFGTGNL